MASRKENFEKSIKYVELENDGSVKKVLGVCKASDLQEKPVFRSAKKMLYDGYWDDDVFLELGIRRMQ